MTSIEKTTHELYENVIDNLHDPLHVINSKFKLIFINRAMKKWLTELGISNNLLGLSLFKAFPFLSQKIHDEYKFIIKEGKSLVTKETNSMFNQKIIVETRKIPIIQDGKVVQIITIVRDITTHEIAKQRLKESEGKFKSFFKGGLIPTYAWQKVGDDFILIDYR